MKRKGEEEEGGEEERVATLKPEREDPAKQSDNGDRLFLYLIWTKKFH